MSVYISMTQILKICIFDLKLVECLDGERAHLEG
jgi:hypothetical protein